MGAQVLAEAALHEVSVDRWAHTLADYHARARGYGSGRRVRIEVHDQGTAAGAAAPGDDELVLGPAADPR